jgi:hypothetical protein
MKFCSKIKCVNKNEKEIRKERKRKEQNEKKHIKVK